VYQREVKRRNIGLGRASSERLKNLFGFAPIASDRVRVTQSRDEESVAIGNFDCPLEFCDRLRLEAARSTSRSTCGEDGASLDSINTLALAASMAMPALDPEGDDRERPHRLRQTMH
jgi:hypothetical protein